jgi:hypothetical protein
MGGEREIRKTNGKTGYESLGIPYPPLRHPHPPLLAIAIYYTTLLYYTTIYYTNLLYYTVIYYTNLVYCIAIWGEGVATGGDSTIEIDP